MRIALYSFVFGLLAILATACSLQRDIKLDLPQPAPEMVVQGYLQPGFPYIVALQESSPYFKPFSDRDSLPMAEVMIFHKKDTIQLFPIDSTTLSLFLGNLGPRGIDLLNQLNSSGLLRVFISNPLLPTGIVPEDYNTSFELLVKDTKGRVITGSTTLPPLIPIDSVLTPYNDAKTKAYTLTQFRDPAEPNFYRRIVRRRVSQYDTIREGGAIVRVDSSRRNELYQDFTVSDDIFNGGNSAFGTGFDFKAGDTVSFELHSIPAAYYQYSESVQGASQANGNPFGVPALIQSNVKGGIGIFTAYSVASKTVVIPKP